MYPYFIISDNFCVIFLQSFSALTLLFGCQEKHLACKNWMMRCRCGYLPGARSGLFAYGPANPIISGLIQIQIGFTFLVPAYPEKRPLNGCSSSSSLCDFVVLLLADLLYCGLCAGIVW